VKTHWAVPGFVQWAVSVFVLLFINLLPYLCRLPHGMNWVKQYVPDSGLSLEWILWFHAFASLPSIPPILAALIGKKGTLAFILSLVISISFLAYYHHDYDLASDAQAAVGLVFIPVYATSISTLGFLIGLGLQSKWKSRANKADTGFK